MQLTIISDTHNQHDDLGHLSGDVLIHCGDMFNILNSDENDITRMDAWFGEQDFDLILCIGGNHDLSIEKKVSHDEQPFKNAVYLQGQSYQYKNITFFGAPWVPELSSHAFYVEESELKQKWADIPDNVDVLITHTPPFGILDVCSRGSILGCKHLLNAVKKIKPRMHCFGHVHHSSGQKVIDETTFINAAQLNHYHTAGMKPFQLKL